jgi:hypothetical protein
MEFVDKVAIVQGIVSIIFFTSWGIWSENVHNFPFSDLSGFLKAAFCAIFCI